MSEGRGGRNGAAGGTRALSSALRSAGIGGGSDDRMELDGGVGRAGGRHKRTGARSAGPLDQSGRRSKDTPYAKPGGNKALSSRISGLNASPSSSKKKTRNGDPRRAPAGTPDILRNDDRKGAQARQQRQHSNLNAILKGDEIKGWLRSRIIAPGVLNFSNLNDDPWLKSQGVIPPGDRQAPPNTGSVFWRLAQSLETPEQRIYTLDLSNNGFISLSQLSELPRSLPYVRALSLESNPISRSDELKHLQSRGEQLGKAGSGAGSFKSLIELKLNDCKFREDMIKQPGGAEKYTHDVLRRFPGLLMLDGVQLNRVVFPLERKPIVKRSDEDRKALLSRPFTYPVDVISHFEETEECRAAVMAFCDKFFRLWDANRSEVIDGYHPEATISISANTLPSRSFQAKEVAAVRTRPAPVSFDAWVNLPGRNFFRSCTTIEQRQNTLKSPMDMEGLKKWLLNRIPVTEHPMTDASKWCIDSWYLGDENERICAVIQGEFTEKPSGTFRSFTRTFVLVAVPEGSVAAAKGWPCCVLSDTMVVHSYLGTGSFDQKSSLAKGDISIVPPSGVAPLAPPMAPTLASTPDQAALIAQVHQLTGMNPQFSEMCLVQNEWNVERAVANFNEIRPTIPPEAFV